jgi:hypothetical protein
MVIVEVDEVLVVVRSYAVGVPVADVGPFFEQDSVEAFDLAVGSWPVGPSERGVISSPSRVLLQSRDR